MKQGALNLAGALVLWLVCPGSSPAPAQEPLATPLINPALASAQPAAKKHRRKKDENDSSGQPQSTSSSPPTLSIPVSPLGFTAPAAFNFGSRLAQVSLDFLDENTLLFTFRVPLLIPREKSATSETPGNERRIRAVVLSLPTGSIAAQALWTLHDYSPYLWPLKNGKFLLRDQNIIQTGNPALQLDPFLRFPGSVRSLELDPGQQLLIANTAEEAPADSASNSALNPPTAAASITTDEPTEPDNGSAKKPNLQALLRIFRMDTGKVVLLSRVPGITHLPLDGEGYYEALRGKGNSWLITYQHFAGATNPLLQIDSTCSPSLYVPAPTVVLASGCTPDGGRRLVAMTQSKQRLWDATLPATQVWPLIARSLDGSRIARATLQVAHPVSPTNPLAMEEVRAQVVTVYDLATGKVALTAQSNPTLDGGGNFALSPSGNRFAVLNSGQIQVFDLPQAPSLPPPTARN